MMPWQLQVRVVLVVVLPSQLKMRLTVMRPTVMLLAQWCAALMQG